MEMLEWDARSYDVLPLPHGHWARRAIAQLRLNYNEMVLGGLAGGVHFAWYAALFACGAGDGNRTRTVSLGIRYGPAIHAPVAGSDVAVSDLT